MTAFITDLESEVAFYEGRLARAKRRLQTALDADEKDIVLVEFRPFGTPYAYRLPKDYLLDYASGNEDVGRPKIGSEFLAPPSWSSANEAVVTVVGYGRGGYTGPVKTLTGRVIR